MVRVLRSSILAFAVAAVVMAGVGCRAPQDPAAASRSIDGETSAAATQSATPSAVTTPAPDPAQPRVESLDATQARALEAELQAIERELDQLDLPSDSDFSGIESQLP